MSPTAIVLIVVVAGLLICMAALFIQGEVEARQDRRRTEEARQRMLAAEERQWRTR